VLPAAASLPAIDAAINPRSLAVEVSIDTFAAPVEMLIDSIALAVELRCEAVTAIFLGAPGTAVEAIVDVVALAIKARLNTISAVIESVLDPVARIGQCAARNQQQSGSAHDEFSRIHDGLPSILTNIVCSGLITQPCRMR
jgi:replication-associated recombination protein RarA